MRSARRRSVPGAMAFASGDCSPPARVRSSSLPKTSTLVVIVPGLLSVAVNVKPTFSRSCSGGQSVLVPSVAVIEGGAVSSTVIETTTAFE